MVLPTNRQYCLAMELFRFDSGDAIPHLPHRKVYNSENFKIAKEKTRSENYLRPYEKQNCAYHHQSECITTVYLNNNLRIKLSTRNELTELLVYSFAGNVPLTKLLIPVIVMTTWRRALPLSRLPKTAPFLETNTPPH